MADNRKKSVHLPEDMIEEIKKEADRLDRSISWVVQQAWLISKDKKDDD